MKIAVLKESLPGERRVALLPGNVTRLARLGYEVLVESHAGVGSGIADQEYSAVEAGLGSRSEILRAADLVLQVRGLGANPDSGRIDLDLLRPGHTLVGMHEPLWRPEAVRDLAARGVTVLALETIPRITRAQTMDVLSSMATLAGYGAVVLAARRLTKIFPMLMTAAGTIAPTKVLVLGAGVAGLQAIATARRMGAVVVGYDIRPAAMEQIRSLGAKVVEIPEATPAAAEDRGGYAREQDEDQQRRQREALAAAVAESDVVITTAAVPGARSPLLLTREMVERMRPGSVVVDLAAERGGNCELTEADDEVEHRGILVLGPTDLPSRYARHASQMFGNNVTALLTHLTKDGTWTLDPADEIAREVTVALNGEVTHPRVREKLGLAPLEVAAQPAPSGDATAPGGIAP
ncbi:MAG TPA: Re/Si-specific NAD(P)(+) transhydrogenase subunit alpha [Thermoanaerobaculia bacterium]|nr:Re/Si-specific NAD(P)(+) transhydrogenase subunit alpha [Thermoanaerobaculia bacterium]